MKQNYHQEMMALVPVVFTILWPASALQSFSPKLPFPLNAYSALPEMLNSLENRNSTSQNLLFSWGWYERCKVKKNYAIPFLEHIGEEVALCHIQPYTTSVHDKLHLRQVWVLSRLCPPGLCHYILWHLHSGRKLPINHPHQLTLHNCPQPHLQANLPPVFRNFPACLSP